MSPEPRVDLKACEVVCCDLTLARMTTVNTAVSIRLIRLTFARIEPLDFAIGCRGPHACLVIVQIKEFSIVKHPYMLCLKMKLLG